MALQFIVSHWSKDVAIHGQSKAKQKKASLQELREVEESPKSVGRSPEVENPRSFCSACTWVGCCWDTCLGICMGVMAETGQRSREFLVRSVNSLSQWRARTFCVCLLGPARKMLHIVPVLLAQLRGGWSLPCHTSLTSTLLAWLGGWPLVLAGVATLWPHRCCFC